MGMLERSKDAINQGLEGLQIFWKLQIISTPLDCIIEAVNEVTAAHKHC